MLLISPLYANAMFLKMQQSSSDSGLLGIPIALILYSVHGQIKQFYNDKQTMPKANTR
jgi:hypothetical protein